MNNPVSHRLGRHRHRMKAERKRMLEKLNQLAKETGLRGDLARSILIDPDEEFERAYTHGEHSHAAE